MKSRLFWKHWGVAVVTALSFIACTSAAEVPEPVRQLVFETSRFATPVRVNVPSDEADTYRHLKEKYPNGEVSGFLGLMPVGVTIEYGDTPESWREFLVHHDYVTILSLTLRGRTTEQYRFIGQTDKLKKLIDANGSYSDLARSYSIVAATRELESINYQNEYTAEIRGVEIPMFSLTFSYTLNEKMSDLPDIDSVLAGKATAYLDPRDGHWKLDELSLSDGGGSEYLRIIRDIQQEGE